MAIYTSICQVTSAEYQPQRASERRAQGIPRIDKSMLAKWPWAINAIAYPAATGNED